MRDPELSARIIETVAKNVSVPVTVKIRKGWDKGHCNAVSFAQMAEQAGASAIAVHGRTKTQMYAGVADWDCITAVKQAVSIQSLQTEMFFPVGMLHIFYAIPVLTWQ